MKAGNFLGGSPFYARFCGKTKQNLKNTNHKQKGENDDEQEIASRKGPATPYGKIKIQRSPPLSAKGRIAKHQERRKSNEQEKQDPSF
jgi:hypothetical protein